MKVEVAMQPQAKEHQKLQKAGRRKKQLLPMCLKERRPALSLTMYFCPARA